MSWVSMLAKTYEHCKDDALNAKNEKDLLPVCHTTQNAQIEITIDGYGNFRSARVLRQKKGPGDEENEAVTVIPCTEGSANRTSGLEPHPLFDKLQYIAGDFIHYNASKKSGYDLYIEKLEMWCNSPYSNEMVKSIFTYVKKKTMISDLIKGKILFMGESGDTILEEWDGDENEKPAIFTLSTKPMDSFVRLCVEIPGRKEFRTWLDVGVRQDFINYYLNSLSDADICYVSGETLPISRLSSAKIRHTGDKARLISSNDKSGFTFRGRFITAEQAMCISYDASQKYVNALKWLVSKQGYRNGDQVIVAWGTRDESIPSAFEDSFDLTQPPEEDQVVDTRGEFASRLNKTLAGYSASLDDSSEVVVMGVDSATVGRLSIIYYRELTGSEFLKRVERWHKTASWYPLFHNGVDKAGKMKWFRFYGAPAPGDIAEAAYGVELNDKLRKATIERLLPCIIDGKPLPWDIIQAASRRASRPVSMERWEYNKTIGVVCALIRKYLNDKENDRGNLNEYKEVWTVDLNDMENNRSYLFGCLLAYARKIEEYSLYKSGQEPRQTNAERMMTRFRQHPAKTWAELYQRLLPYLAKFRNTGVGSFGNRYEAGMNAVVAQLNETSESFSNDSLRPEYLLGYQSQLNQFEQEYQEFKAKKAAKDDGVEQ
ncbi:MAG: type I-C CRISPR-associated protein Cas8c/Csd1 [Methanomicrobiales archaeon]|jgi:CRISPR-associated protein Csd1|nr:type I-C CRISPR-associated protein Cas8c/Csd1 [Methanomicrobiales archaeon]